MAEFPALPLYTDAYLGDTRHLTTVEHGAYLLLLMIAWRSGGELPNDDRRLARYAGLTLRQWQRIKPVILDFFELENGVLVQPRLSDELVLVRRKRNAAIANGRASALKRHERHSTKRERKANEALTPKPKPKPNDSPNGESNPLSPFEAPQPEWSQFADYRKSIGKKLTPHAVKLNLATLERLANEGHDPREVINQTIERGWTGFFPIKEDYRGREEQPGGRTGAAASSLLAELEERDRAEGGRGKVIALPSAKRHGD